MSNSSDPLNTCSEPGCVALASDGRRCAVHARPPVPPALEDSRPNDHLNEVLTFLYRRYGRLLNTYLLGVEIVSLPMPALLDFHFYSPEARVLISADLGGDRLVGVLGHQLAHLAQQARRFRRRSHRGLCPPLGVGGDSAYFPWCDVDWCLERGSLELPYGHRDRLAAAAPPCPRCARRPERLMWTYFTSPAETWQGLAGCAGWLAVCRSCNEQVAFFMDRCN